MVEVIMPLFVALFACVSVVGFSFFGSFPFDFVFITQMAELGGYSADVALSDSIGVGMLFVACGIGAYFLSSLVSGLVLLAARGER